MAVQRRHPGLAFRLVGGDEARRPAAVGVLPGPWGDDEGDAGTEPRHFFTNVLNTLQEAYVRPRYSGWPSFQTRLGEILHQFLKDDSDPPQILEQLQDEYTRSYLFHP